jgi:hypothetical protein
MNTDVVADPKPIKMEVFSSFIKSRITWNVGLGFESFNFLNFIVERYEWQIKDDERTECKILTVETTHWRIA